MTKTDRPKSDKAIASMTGFARREGGDARASWVWEVKAVNGKGLDLRVRLPYGSEELEGPARKAAQARFSRGHLSINLSLRGVGGTSLPRVNEQALAAVKAAAEALRAADPQMPPASPEGLLSLKGVIEVSEEELSEAEQSARARSLLTDLEACLDALGAARASEGRELESLLTEQLSTIVGLVERAEGAASARPEALKERLRQKLAEILESDPPLPEERLAQEVALLVTKADIREELDRLKAHVQAAREMIAGGGAVGRRLDFLCQEFNREANTLCSKSQDVELTSIGLELKHVIDQLREQVQNIE